MSRYLVRRLLQLIPVVLLITVLTFALQASMPSDPLDMLIMGNPEIREEDIERLKEFYGLNDPIPVRYLKWMRQVMRADFGYSRNYGIPVIELVIPRLKNTMILTSLALLLALGVSMPWGIFSSTHQYSLADYVGTFLAFFGFAVPNFWLGLVLIIVFSIRLRWLPPGGIYTVMMTGNSLARLIDRIKYLIMPVFVASLVYMAVWTRYMRSSMVEVIRQEYIQTAHAKGLSERAVLYKHALKNALLPIITAVGNMLPALFGGSVVIEQVFSYPGMGKLLYDSILENDYSVTMCIILLFGLMVVLFNLLADACYAVIDPRVRYD
jgi:peptide/nickel transport system permease protein